MSKPDFNAPDYLSDELLETFRNRAAGYDRDNIFFTEDFNDLVELGYLKAFVPKALGGWGLTLQQVSTLQQRLATAAPATALGVNMHLVWSAVATALANRGDNSHEIVLQETAAGEIFAFGVSEPGNDLVLFDSNTRAEPQPDGSYRYFGQKIFTTLSPVWTRLGTFGRDDTDPARPQLVFGFVDRASGGFEISDSWDVLGMRATQSRATKLDGALSDARRITGKISLGDRSDPLIFAIFANFLLLIASVYAGIAERGLQVAVQTAKAKQSKAAGTNYAALGDTRSRIADMAILFEGIRPQLDAVTSDVDNVVNHGASWFTRLVGTKIRTIEAAHHILDEAMRVAGGTGFSNSSELSRLYRDVLAGRYHPSNLDSARATFANYYLGPLG